MSQSTIQFESIGSTALITLNRPEALNAVNEALTRDVNAGWDRFRDDPDLLVAVITGSGDRAFCAGADLKEVASSFRDAGGEMGTHDARSFPMSPRDRGVEKPIICAVNGVCVGAGLSFVFESDLVIASESASFIDPHPRWAGVNPDIIEEWGRLPLGWTMRLVFGGSGQRLSARDAYRFGLVGEVVPPDRLRDRALELAEALATAPPAAVRAQKEAIWAGYDSIVARALDLSRDIRMDFRRSGGKDLLAKRTSSFSPRDSGE